MDIWRAKELNELLSLFTKFHSSNRDDNGANYMCKYIESILEEKGYDIVIKGGNEYRLEPHIPTTKEKLYDMPIKELMDLHHKLVTKETLQYIPLKLRKTLIRRTKDIVINRGYIISYDNKGVPDFRINPRAINHPEEFYPYEAPICNIGSKNSISTRGRSWKDYPDMMQERAKWNAIWSQPPFILDHIGLLYPEKPNHNDIVISKLFADAADSILSITSKNRGAAFHDAIFNPDVIVFDNVKDAIEYNQLTGCTNYIVTQSNVKPLNKPSVKNILVRIDNNDLVNYVYNKLRKALNIKPDMTVSIAPNTLKKFAGIDICGDRCNIVDSDVRLPPKSVGKEFTITSAANADTIISEVVKEYNKPDYKEFHIDSSFGSPSFKVQVHKSHLIFNGRTMTFSDFFKLHSAANTIVSNYKIGGIETILLTDSNTDAKLYIDRQMLGIIKDCIMTYSNYAQL